MKLTQLERQLLRYQGVPAHVVAKAERITVDRVLEVWASLKDRGVMAGGPHHQHHEGPADEQLSFDQVDRMMRGNRAPVMPANPEIGWTPETEGSW
jgi:hypothetical protein